MLGAITSTFSELWNMRDPNASANPFRVGQPKKKEAIRRYLHPSQTGVTNTAERTKTPNTETPGGGRPPTGAARDT